MPERIDGFSKRSKAEKIDWIVQRFTHDPDYFRAVLEQYWNDDAELQRIHDEFSENTISNFYLPLGVAPNFLINGKTYAIPMAIEESSVVAAASNAAKYWMTRGGFHTDILGTEKIGQVHFLFGGDAEWLQKTFHSIRPVLLQDLEDISRKMRARGGGVTHLELRNQTQLLDDYYQLHVSFETVDAMGANFINSCLEQLAVSLDRELSASMTADKKEASLEIVMSILSNYVPGCLARAEVRCSVEQLDEDLPMEPQVFAQKLIQAIAIARAEPYRAVTHNKGIMNGVDGVVLATGNDFRAVEAGVHAYAARDGAYRGLTEAWIKDGIFTMRLDLPLALGTVGGITRLHPLVRFALEVLGKPSARELMAITAVAGLAQNFAALRSLITTGIQQGHMKMHLLNILNQLGATPEEKDKVVDHFKSEIVSYRAAEEVLQQIRQS